MHRRNLNILYVDDNPEERDMFADVLDEVSQSFADAGADGLYLETVSSDDAALFSMRIRIFDLLICDYQLANNKTATDLIETLRHDGVQIPIAVTSTLPESQMAPCLQQRIQSNEIRLLSKDDWQADKIEQLLHRMMTAPLEILYVEDDEDDAEFVAEALQSMRKYEARVHRARNAQEAREMSQHVQFDVQLVDANLGADNGIDLARELHDKDDTAATIVISGMASDSSEIRRLNKSFFAPIGFVSKNDWNSAMLVRNVLCKLNCPPEHTIPGVSSFSDRLMQR